MDTNTAHSLIFKSYNPFSEYSLVEDIWISMLQECPHTYYLSWQWIDIWLKSLPSDCKIELVVGFIDDVPNIAFFLGTGTTTLCKFLAFNQVSLNQTLIHDIDVATYVEYNTILIKPTTTISLGSLLGILPVESWDEFQIERYSSNYNSNFTIDDIPVEKYHITAKKISSYYVDLDKVRRNNNDYLGLLSRNRRKRILRAQKDYEKLGEIRLHSAENLGEAFKILDELIHLHRKRWTAQGFPGAFSTKYFMHFHKALISERFGYGEIQLLKISSGNKTIGCIYNYVYNGEIYTISGGFNYALGDLSLPGFVCDYYTVLHYAALGFKRYDFMSGDVEYKESLSTDKNEMYTITIQKRNLKHHIQKMAHTKAIRKITGLIKRFIDRKSVDG